MSLSTVCKNGIGPGAMSDTERMSDQCPPTPPPLTDNHLNSDVWSMSPCNESSTYVKKQLIGNALTLSPGKGAFESIGLLNINQPLLTAS